MIDTLRLNLVDCEIKRNCPLQIQQPIIDFSTGKKLNESDLFIDSTGKIVTGSKAFLNDDKFNLTINPTLESELNDETGKSNLTVKRFKRIVEDQHNIWDYNYEGEDQVKGIFLQTSLPRLLSKTNYKTLKLDEQKNALKTLEQRLKRYGIRTNIYNANLSRIDTFTNIQTDHKFFSYSRLFSLMDCGRMKSIDWNEESYLWKNGQQELMIYDKVKEMKFKNPKIPIRTKKNIMRIENRLMKKRKIESSIKFKTLGELYKNYDELKHFHKKEVESKIFKYDIDEIEYLDQSELERKLRMFKKHYGKGWLRNYLLGYGIYSIMSLTNENDLFEIIEIIEGDKGVKSRVRKSRLKKEIRRYKLFFKLAEKNNNKTSNVELYNELKQKFYKIAA